MSVASTGPLLLFQ